MGWRVGKNRVTYGLIVVLFACAMVNVIPWCQIAPPADLITMYSAGTMVRRGENPYNDQSLKNAWSTICLQQKCSSEERKTVPGLPCALLYPPNTLFMYALCSMLPWRYLVVMFRCLLVVLLLSVIWMAWKQQQPRNVTGLLLVALACMGLNGIPWLLVSINTSVFVYFFLMLFYWSFKKNHDIRCGFFLGAMSLKITLMLPLFVFICIRKKWKIVLVSLIVAGIPFLLLWCKNAAFTVELITSWMHAANEWDRLLYAIYPGRELWYGEQAWSWNRMLDYLTTLGPIVSFYLRYITGAGSYMAAKAIALGVAALLCLIVFLISRKREIRDEHLIVMLTCVELLVNYHMQYDTIVPLLFILLVWGSVPRRVVPCLLGAVSLYYIPFNGLFLLLEIPKQWYLWAFNMALPLVVVFICAGMMCREKPGPAMAHRADVPDGR